MPKVNLATRINTHKPKFNKGAVKVWDKAYRKAQQAIKENGFSAKMISPLNRDLVEISKKKEFPPVDPIVADREMMALDISRLRVLGAKTYSGETLENSPDKLKKLKELGINTVVDFREEAFDTYKNLCSQNGLEYFQFPLKHSANFNVKEGVSDEFVDNMKRFFEIFNQGNAYMGCKFGIDRTNLALMMNYLVNPEVHMIPEITAWGGDSLKNVINKNQKIIEKLCKSLTPAQKEKLELSSEYSYLMKRRSKNLMNKAEF